MNESELELELNGFEKQYDYSQYAHDNNVNVIPEEAFKRLVRDTFKTITETLRATYGPYGSSVVISDQSETTTTKDGYNVFTAMGFNHAFKRMVYLAIQKIIVRVNRNVGDGTTSCILLAEKIFNNLNAVIKSADDKRRILGVLSELENNLQDTREIEEGRKCGMISPLKRGTLFNLINLAANYDEDLTATIMESLDPICDEDGNVIRVRNVITDQEITLDSGSSASYSIDYLPGDYRVRIEISTDSAIELATPKQMKCVIYDHAFNQTDWKNFKKSYNNEPTIILARTFTKGFLSQEWVDYLKELHAAKRFGQGSGDVNVYLAAVKGDFVQHEIQDVAALIGTEARDLNALEVDHNELPVVKIQVYKGNCLAFFDCKDNDLSVYINKLETEMRNDESHSYVKEKEYKARIKALSMISSDTSLTVKTSTSLEAKLITDKIDDCISIVNSAIDSGTVPNMLSYAYRRIQSIRSEISDTYLGEIGYAVCDGMLNAIMGLFDDIWKSKFGDNNNRELYKDSVEKMYLGESMMSYDIVSNKFVEQRMLPTSAQYDLEVVVAAISIVKYLLTGRALIFDAHILPAVNDGGHYTQKY